MKNLFLALTLSLLTMNTAFAQGWNENQTRQNRPPVVYLQTGPAGYYQAPPVSYIQQAPPAYFYQQPVVRYVPAQATVIYTSPRVIYVRQPSYLNRLLNALIP